MAVLVYKALNGLSPQYLADDCQLITTTGRRRLRLMLLPATFHEPAQLWAIDPSLLLVHTPHLWNNLPLHLRDFELSLSEFRRLLKTLKIAAPSDLLLDVMRFTNVITYLLNYLHHN